MRHAIIDQSNEVVNIIIWEGAEWLPPRNHTVVQSDSAAIGDIYEPTTGTFSKPNA